MRVLLVEDDATIAGFVDKGLREAGFAVIGVFDRVSDRFHRAQLELKGIDLRQGK